MRRLAAAIVGAAAMLAMPATALADYGQLDTTFSGDGMATQILGPTAGVAYAVAAAPDGGIVAGGYTRDGADQDMAVVYYNEDGSLNTEFGSNGVVTTAYSPNFDEIRAIDVQEDGKVVAGGFLHNGSNYDAAIVRYNTDGSLDTSFSGDGLVTIVIGAQAEQVRGLVLQPDGKIVVTGFADTGTVNEFFAARINSNGTMDAGFGGGDGIVTTAIGPSNSAARAVALQKDGKILSAGYMADGVGGNHDQAIVRYNQDGSLDTSFNGTGIVTLALSAENDIARGIRQDDQGRIVVTGYGELYPKYDIQAVRLLADGSLDPSFDGDGKASLAIGPDHEAAYAAAIDAAGNIVAAGEHSPDGARVQAALAAFSPEDGSLADDWGSGGTAIVDLGDPGGDSAILGADMDADGRIVVAGFAEVGGLAHLAVARFGHPLPDEPDDPVDLPQPTGCHGVTHTQGSQSYSELWWNAVAHPDLWGYQVQWRKKGNGGWETRYVTGTYTKITGHLPGKSYEYRVRSKAHTDQGTIYSDWCNLDMAVEGGGRQNGSGGADTLTGFSGRDVLSGRAGNDVIRGLAGNDVIRGGSGNDKLAGNAGNDRISGDAGRDLIYGGAGRDRLDGRSGADKIIGGPGRDRIRAGDGNDRVHVRDGRSGDVVSCGRGRDMVVADRGDRISGDCERVRRR